MKLLIVDDSRLIRFQMESLITLHFPSVDVKIAEDGDMALKVIRQYKPQIVLLDIIMPKKNGIEVLESLQNLLEVGELKVLMFSSIDDKVTLKQCFELGASDFINKPLDEMEAIARLGSAIKTMNLFMEHIHAKEALLVKNKELEKLNKELVQARSRLMQAEKLAGIGQLAAGVAHEINNPIGFVNSNMHTLHEYVKQWIGVYKIATDQHLDETTKMRYITQSVNTNAFHYMMDDVESLFEDTAIGIERVKAIVQSLRSFSRIDQPGEDNWFDLNQGIKDTLIIAHSQYSYVANVVTEYGDIPVIQVDGGKINQVILNVLLNAIDAIKEKFMDHQEGQIVIKTYQEGKDVVFLIQDNGCGMPMEVIEQLFNPFFTTKSVGAGTGLGMSVSYDIIVNLHRGKIDAHSKVGEGTTLIIKLPLQE